jgi:hypothetical protein
LRQDLSESRGQFNAFTVRRGGYESSITHVVLVALNSTSTKYPRKPVKPPRLAMSGVKEISIVFSSPPTRVMGSVEMAKSLSNHSLTSFFTLNLRILQRLELPRALQLLRLSLPLRPLAHLQARTPLL